MSFSCRHVVLFQELILLKEFEKTENVLSAKLQEKVNEKAAMDKMVNYFMSIYIPNEISIFP
jgi:hypothetical protein